jgi:hypothetical protein
LNQDAAHFARRRRNQTDHAGWGKCGTPIGTDETRSGAAITATASSPRCPQLSVVSRDESVRNVTRRT